MSSPPVDRDADLHLGRAEGRRLGGEADVAQHGDLEAGAEAVAVQRDDERLRQLLDQLHAPVRAAKALVVVAHALGRPGRFVEM
jgi:hypothetical protein